MPTRLLFLLLFLLVATCLYVLRGQSRVAQAQTQPAQPRTVTGAVLIDLVQDPKGTGYPDSRKLVRDSHGNLYVGYRKKFLLKQTVETHVFVAKSTDNGQSWAVANQGKPVERVGDFKQRVPSLVIDSHDVIHVVWYGLDAHNLGSNDRQIKYVRSTDAGATWSKWRNIAKVKGYQGEELWQEHPVIYVDAGNNLYIVWEGKDENSPKAQIKLIRSSDGGDSWDKKCCNIAEDADASFSRPTLVESQGTLYVLAYAKYANKPVAQVMWSQSIDRGAHWSAWQFVAPSSQDQRHISAAVDGDGRLHVVWRQRSDAVAGQADLLPTQIYYASYNAQAGAGHWSQAEPIAPAKQYQFFPSLTIDQKNQPWVVWLESASDGGVPKDNPPPGAPMLTHKSQAGWQSTTQLCQETAATFPTLRWQPHYLGPANATQGIDVVWTSRDESGQLAVVYCSG